MESNPILSLPLDEVMRGDIALPLQHMLQLYTVGSLLGAWRNPRNHRNIEQLFDNPAQAHEAVAVCAAWLGLPISPAANSNGPWWRDEIDDSPRLARRDADLAADAEYGNYAGWKCSRAPLQSKPNGSRNWARRGISQPSSGRSR